MKSRTNQSSKKHRLELYPWRDDIQFCIRAIDSAPNTESVGLVWNPTDQDVCNDDVDLTSLFEYIGTNMQHLKSVTIQFNNNDLISTKTTTTASGFWTAATLASPPISSITTLLTSSESIQSLTLIGLQFTNDDDLDMNGFYETIRIHPSLHTLVIQNCTFVKPSHLLDLKNVTYNTRSSSTTTATTKDGIKRRHRWKHLDISDNDIMATTRQEQFAHHTSSSKDTSSSLFSCWESSPFLSWCLHPVTCCV